MKFWENNTNPITGFKEDKTIESQKIRDKKRYVDIDTYVLDLRYLTEDAKRSLIRFANRPQLRFGNSLEVFNDTFYKI